jgi:hypothetical protein
LDARLEVVLELIELDLELVVLRGVRVGMLGLPLFVLLGVLVERGLVEVLVGVV